jgi:hypothetical protein
VSGGDGVTVLQKRWNLDWCVKVLWCIENDGQELVSDNLKDLSNN